MKHNKEVYEIFSEELDLFYKRFNEGFFAFIGVLIAIISISLAFVLYTSVDSSFSIFSHWISNLGAGPNGADVVFNSGMIVTSLFTLIFLTCSFQSLQQKGVNKELLKVSFVAGLISSIGLFFVGVFPMDTARTMHGIAASTFFIGMLFFSIFIGITELTSPKIPKLQAISGFLVAVFFAAYLICGLLAWSDIHSVQFLRNAIFTEWLTLFVILAWMLERAIYTIVESIRNNMVMRLTVTTSYEK
ncbi:MAG: DUF998 domain-containing protein [Promethearchaeota archaeon]